MTQQEFIERYHYDATRDLLGKGGFGRVYRAYDRIEHEYVAIKLQVVDPEHPELRLSKEVEKVQQYVHRYIARYKGCYTIPSLGGEMDIAVMKYYKDGSLDALIKSKKLDLEARFVMLRQILEGIAFLHSHGIIHRDLKPQNILIAEYDGTYEPLITDFGISKQLADGESSAVSNSILGGTYSYASPEQLKETTIRKNTDLWSFGIIAYQMLTGALPFNCGTFSPTSQEGRQEQFRQMTSGVLPEALNNIPEPWQTLIRECLVVDNTQRLTHVEDCMVILNNQPDDVTVDESTIVDTPVEVEVVTEPVKEEVKPRIDTPKQKEQPKSVLTPKSFLSKLFGSLQKGADPININGHYAVDLGLSVKWATCNVGATRPEGYGNYYAWGETSPKTSYTKANSKTYDKSIGGIGGNSRYDAATANWGSGWRLPTRKELDELRDKCTWTWATLNGVNGYEVKSKKNGNSIFLPATGYYRGDTPCYQGSYGYYWSSTPYYTPDAYYLHFYSGGHGTTWCGSGLGRSVRPVAE